MNDKFKYLEQLDILMEAMKTIMTAIQDYNDNLTKIIEGLKDETVQEVREMGERYHQVTEPPQE